MKLSTVVAAFCALIAGPASAATYNINLSNFDALGSTITGTMTYNALDAIGAPDSFSLTISSPAYQPFDTPMPQTLTQSNAQATYIGLDGMNARATGLTFDMDAGPFFAIVGDLGISGSPMGFCIGGVGANSLSGFPGFYPCEGGIGIISQGSVASLGSSTGVIQLGSVATPVPLPAGLPLMASGLVLLAFVRRRKVA